MKTKIIEISKPLEGKFTDNIVVSFEYFNRIVSAIVTDNSLKKYFKRESLSVGQDIEVMKGFKNNKIQYRLVKIY